MCGLVAVLSKYNTGLFESDIAIFTQMLFSDTLRGADATGVMTINRWGNMKGIKCATPAPFFLINPEWTDFMRAYTDKMWLVGHNRKAIKGAVGKSENAHPFHAHGITLVHNGYIANADVFAKTEVDSEAVVFGLHNHGVDATINSLEGAFALIWYDSDKKRIYFTRNKERPLYILETASRYVLCSEHDMGYWIIKRNNSIVTEVHDVEANKLYWIDLSKPAEINSREFDTTQKVKPAPKKGQKVHHHIPASTVDNIPDTNVVSMKRTQKAGEKPLNSWFVHDSDIKLFGTNAYKTEERVLIEVESIEYNANECLELTGIIANTTTDGNGNNGMSVTARWFTKDDQEIERIRAAGYVYGEVQALCTNITTKSAWVTCKNIRPVFANISANDVAVPHAAYIHEDFDNQCIVCQDFMKFNEIPESKILITRHNKAVCVCPKCANGPKDNLDSGEVDEISHVYSQLN